MDAGLPVPGTRPAYRLLAVWIPRLRVAARRDPVAQPNGPVHHEQPVAIPARAPAGVRADRVVLMTTI